MNIFNKEQVEVFRKALLKDAAESVIQEAVPTHFKNINTLCDMALFALKKIPQGYKACEKDGTMWFADAGCPTCQDKLAPVDETR